jgi:ParB-like chromosome segregation protein Spo0J
MRRTVAKAIPEPEWPADTVGRMPIGKLLPYARNARQHSDAQIAQIAASIKEWGWTIPVLVDEANTLIAGHGRVLAAHQLGLPDVPTMVARGWSEAKVRAYRIADNKLALNSSWDDELLKPRVRGLDRRLRPNADRLRCAGYRDAHARYTTTWGVQ